GVAPGGAAPGRQLVAGYRAPVPRRGAAADRLQHPADGLRDGLRRVAQPAAADRPRGLERVPGIAEPAVALLTHPGALAWVHPRVRAPLEVLPGLHVLRELRTDPCADLLARAPMGAPGHPGAPGGVLLHRRG